jgi:spore germination protein KB
VLSDKNKVSLYQAMLLFMTILFTAAIRFVPLTTARKAGRAAWLIPIPTAIVLAVLFILLHNIYKKYPNNSVLDIIEDILGRPLAIVLAALYLMWFVIITSLFTRYYGGRLVATIFPNGDIRIFMICMLAFVGVMLQSGIVTICRMNEIIFYVIVTVFIILIFLMLPQVDIKNLTPITYKDIIPILDGSLSILSLWVYFVYMFFFGDEINDKEKIWKTGIKTTFFLFITTMLFLFIVIGRVGASIVQRLPLPFVASVKIISLFNTLERLESLVVILWISADAILIATMTYITLKTGKYLFKLSTIKPFIWIMLTFIYFFSLYIAKSLFELQSFSAKIADFGDLIFGAIIPVSVYIIGKVRKKI